MSAIESFNLGDFLRIREEDENRRRVDSLNSLAGLTLNDIILSEKRAGQARTLLDVIGAPEQVHDVSDPDRNRNRNIQMERERKTWKALKDRLRLKRNGAALNQSINAAAAAVNPNRRPGDASIASRSSSNGAGNADVSTSSNHRQMGSADVSSGPRDVRAVLNSWPVASTPGDPGPADVSIGSGRRQLTSFPGEPCPADVSIGSRNVRAVLSTRQTASAPGNPGPADVSIGSGRHRVLTPMPAEPSPADVSTGSRNARAAALSSCPVASTPGGSSRNDLTGSSSGSFRRPGATMRLGEHMMMEAFEPVRMSLMELLEETTERQAMAMASSSRLEILGAEAEEEEAAQAAGEQKCCVCMIRHRGAAFIPCGHTFCRACSRELFLQRGNCPLCNAQISEILDIF